jgi:hypothetical protein
MWLVLDAGHSLRRRKILLHPSALGAPDPMRQSIAAKLTKAQIEGSPISQSTSRCRVRSKLSFINTTAGIPHGAAAISAPAPRIRICGAPRG